MRLFSIQDTNTVLDKWAHAYANYPVDSYFKGVTPKEAKKITKDLKGLKAKIALLTKATNWAIRRAEAGELTLEGVLRVHSVGSDLSRLLRHPNGYPGAPIGLFSIIAIRDVSNGVLNALMDKAGI